MKTIRHHLDEHPVAVYLTLVVICFTFIAGLGIGGAFPDETQQDERTLDSPAVVVLVPCVQEDSDDCFWDADTRGNGQGTSFVTIDGHVYVDSGKEVG